MKVEVCWKERRLARERRTCARTAVVVDKALSLRAGFGMQHALAYLFKEEVAPDLIYRILTQPQCHRGAWRGPQEIELNKKRRLLDLFLEKTFGRRWEIAHSEYPEGLAIPEWPRRSHDAADLRSQKPS